MSDKFYVIEQKEIFTVKEAARYLTVAPETVRGLIKNGQLCALKIGKRYKIPANSLSQYVEKIKYSSAYTISIKPLNPKSTYKSDNAGSS